MNCCALGVDIGGTKIASAIVTREGQVLHRQHDITPLHDIPAGVIEVVARHCRTLLATAAQEQHPVAGIGVGTAGQVNIDTGAITYAVATLPGWQGAPLAASLRERTGLPVIVDNDVNALAAGEARFGAGRGFNSGLYVAVGTGIGGAVIIQGRPWRGAHWSAGEIGHILVDWQSDRMCNCGQPGHLEAYAAGPAIAQRYHALTSTVGPDDLRPIARRAAQGDATARQVIAEGARILGLALGGMLNVLDPDVLVIGGGVAEMGELWWLPFEAALRECPMPAAQKVALRRAELGVEAVLIGAAWLALEETSTHAYRTDSA